MLTNSLTARNRRYCRTLMKMIIKIFMNKCCLRK